MNAKIKHKRLNLWIAAGMPSDDTSLDGITLRDITVLQKRVMAAVANKKLADATKMVFAEHRTIQ